MVHRILGLIAAFLFLGGVAAYFDVREGQLPKSPAPARAVFASVEPGAAISEATIAAWEGSPLVMPKTVPAGWTLVYADVLPAPETIEGCHQFELNYEDPDSDAGFLDLYQFPNACAQPFTGGGVTPFAAGEHRGFGRYSPDGGTLVQITVGPSTVQAHSDLSLAELTTVLAEFVALKVPPAQAGG